MLRLAGEDLCLPYHCQGRSTLVHSERQEPKRATFKLSYAAQVREISFLDTAIPHRTRISRLLFARTSGAFTSFKGVPLRRSTLRTLSRDLADGLDFFGNASFTTRRPSSASFAHQGLLFFSSTLLSQLPDPNIALDELCKASDFQGRPTTDFGIDSSTNSGT